MATIANLLIRVGVDTTAANAGLATFGNKASSGLKRSFLPAVGLLTGLGLAVRSTVGDLQRIEKITAQTNAVIASTGGVANVSTAHIVSLADAIEKTTGIEAESVQEGQNLLLTFKNIRNEAGAGNAIFDRTTQALADVSTAMGQSTTTSAIQLGKALNDPVKGIAALQRVGISFTAAQKDQIKALVDSGRTMDAQKLILKELESQFGGSAVAAGQTFGGQATILGHKLGELKEGIVMALLPALMSITNQLMVVVDWMLQNQGAVKAVVVAVALLAAGIIAANIVMKVYAAGVGLVTAAKLIAAGAAKAWAGAQWLLNAALTANPIGIVILAVVGLTAAIILAWQRSATFRAIVTGAFEAVKTAAVATYEWIKANWPLLLTILAGPIGLAVVAIVKHWDKVEAAVAAVKAVIGTIVGAVQAVVNSPALQAVDNAFGTVFGAVKSLINSVASAIDNVIGKVASAVSAVNSLAGKVSSVASTAGGLPGKLWPFANGGIVTRATPSLIGEAGPEVVIPLSRPRRAAELMAATGLDRMAGRGGGPTVHVERMVVQDATDIDRVASRLGRQLQMAG